MRVKDLVLAIAVFAFILFIGTGDTFADDSVIYACKNNRSGRLRIVAPAEQCNRTEALISWSGAGSTGPGSIDRSKVYSKKCSNEYSCLCDNQNDLLLTGGARCHYPDIGKELYYQEVLEMSFPDLSILPPYMGWTAKCRYYWYESNMLWDTNWAVPQDITIMCLAL